MRFISWNIDSLSAALTSDSARTQLSGGVLGRLQEENPDVIAIQETKLPEKGPNKRYIQTLEEWFLDYNYVWTSSCPPARKDYADTITLYKKTLKAEVIFPGIKAPTTMSHEGRVITLELNRFYFTQVYTPNAGNGLVCLGDRQIWNEKFADYLEGLDQEKPVIATGNFNAIRKEIDLKNPGANRWSPGFTDEERLGFSKLLDRGSVDSFRYIHGDVEGVYSWWAQKVRTNKVNNSDWRIDYFLINNRIEDLVIESNMIDSGERQDHTPLISRFDLDKLP